MTKLRVTSEAAVALAIAVATSLVAPTAESAGRSQTPGSEGSAARPGWLAFETIDQSALPVVRARLNGSEGYRLVIDPSFKPIVLDTTIVLGRGMDLFSKNETEVIDFYGFKEEVPVAYLDELALGDVSVTMARTLLVEGDDATAVGGIRAYGRIGRDILEPFRMTVHYPRRLLLLEAAPPGEVPAGGVGFEESGRFLVVPVSIGTGDGVLEVRFVVDAGTSGTVIDRDWAIKNGLATKGDTEARIPSVKVSRFEREDVNLLLGVMKELPYDGTPLGVIGANVLQTMSVTYDFSRNLIWLQPLATPEESAAKTEERTP